MARLFQRAGSIAARNARAASVIILSTVFVLLAIVPGRSHSASAKSAKASISAFSFAGVPGPKVNVPTPNYTVTTSTGALIVPGDTEIGLHADDQTTAITLPFPVILYDQVFTTAN